MLIFLVYSGITKDIRRLLKTISCSSLNSVGIICRKKELKDSRSFCFSQVDMLLFWWY